MGLPGHQAELGQANPEHPYKIWVLSARTRKVAQGSAWLPQSEELACHCSLQACKAPAVSRCFLLFYKVVKVEYVTDLGLQRVEGGGGGSTERTTL